jgi:hypothetical protein
MCHRTDWLVIPGHQTNVRDWPAHNARASRPLPELRLAADASGFSQSSLNQCSEFFVTSASSAEFPDRGRYWLWSTPLRRVLAICEREVSSSYPVSPLPASLPTRQQNRISPLCCTCGKCRPGVIGRIGLSSLAVLQSKNGWGTKSSERDRFLRAERLYLCRVHDVGSP